MKAMSKIRIMGTPQVKVVNPRSPDFGKIGTVHDWNGTGKYSVKFPGGHWGKGFSRCELKVLR
jgi:hypothetical protein